MAQAILLRRFDWTARVRVSERGRVLAVCTRPSTYLRRLASFSFQYPVSRATCLVIPLIFDRVRAALRSLSVLEPGLVYSLCTLYNSLRWLCEAAAWHHFTSTAATSLCMKSSRHWANNNGAVVPFCVSSQWTNRPRTETDIIDIGLVFLT